MKIQALESTLLDVRQFKPEHMEGEGADEETISRVCIRPIYT
jgi:hypothetical protein